MVISFLQYVIVEFSEDNSDSNVDAVFLFWSSFNVASSVVLDNSRYLFYSGQYHPNI